MPTSAVAAADFQIALRALTARRLLVIMDCCHAEGMATAKEPAPALLPPGYSEHALPNDVTAALRQGEGRAVLASSRGAQRSWVRPGGDLSLFTHHLLEALRGAANRPGDTVVRVSHLFTHLSQAVPATPVTSARPSRRPSLTPPPKISPWRYWRAARDWAHRPLPPDAHPTVSAGERSITIGGANTGQISTGDHVTLIQRR